MKLLILSILGAIMAGAALYHMSSAPQNSIPVHIQSAYAHWKLEHGKLTTSLAEDSYRLGVFAQSYATIQKHNAGNSSYKMGLNKFSDMTDAEFEKGYLNSYENDAAAFESLEKITPPTPAEGVADSLDMRDYGAVNPIRDQGHCGSCWSFSVVANVEGTRVIQGRHQLEQYSEQMLVDCSRASHGCDGGNRGATLQEIADNKWGLPRRTDYTSYQGRQSYCRYDASKGAGFITRATGIRTDERSIRTALQGYGPLAVGIYASTLKHYTTGVFDDPCLGNRNHAVNIVGFGTEHGQDYWIVRNSWGTGFGEQGYFRLKRGINHCNIESNVVTAII